MRQLKSRTIHLGILAAAVFLLVFIPNSIRTYAASGTLYVGTRRVSELNRNNILGVRNPDGSATASYDPQTNTLTFNGAVIDAATAGITFYEGGIFVDEGDTPLTIKGNATIRVIQRPGDIIMKNGIIALRDIVFDHCNLNVTSTGAGLFTGNYCADFTFKDSVVSFTTLDGGSAFSQNMNRGNSKTVIQDSSVSFNGGFYGGALTIDGGEVKAPGGIYAYSCEITSRTRRVVASKDSDSALRVYSQSFSIEEPLQIVTPEGGMFKTSGKYVADSNGQAANKVVIAKSADYCFKEFIWDGNDAEGYIGASAVYVNKATGEEISVPIDLDPEVTEPTCTEGGFTTYTAVMEDINADYDGEDHIEIKEGRQTMPTGHEWSVPRYTWENNNSSVYATHFCTKNWPYFYENETVNATSEVTVKPTCTEAGTTVWTSEQFKTPEFEIQTKSEEMPALGHDWSEWEVTKPATETEEGVETRTCRNGNLHF